ncbi:MAG: polyprenyl synthetase family protein [Chlamydiales bacterium]|nr:polyprenyl synthetase family protein [Chlamydiia bacterium]MCP5507500.1 polyprenyl synthetase family protein [Chlamydiales bacterium]
MQQTTHPLQSILEPYQHRTEQAIDSYLLSHQGKDKLHEACSYVLTGSGKRFRPALVMMIADGIAKGGNVTQAALAVEFFHTASLIADDLPCMDDDDERRCKPALHKAYGEATALLASYALIAAGYECLATGAQQLKQSSLPFAKNADAICTAALANATYNTGLNGATGGQYMDLYPSDLSAASVREIIHKKTTSLFEISFVLGWLYGGGDINKLDDVKKAASHFGMAFQIADDLGDQEQDIANERLVNTANIFGLESALEMFHEEMRGFTQTVEALNIKSGDLDRLAALLVHRVNKYRP